MEDVLGQAWERKRERCDLVQLILGSRMAAGGRSRVDRMAAGGRSLVNPRVCKYSNRPRERETSTQGV